MLKYAVYRDDVGEWRWRAKARNGETVADSGEGYVNRSDVYHAINLIDADASIEVE